MTTIPDHDPPGGSTRRNRFNAERLRADVAMLCDLFDRGIEVDGAAVEVEGTAWIIYGRSTYDGEMILAQYDDPAEAAAVLRSLPERVTRRP